MTATAARRAHPLALRRLRQPDPLRRHPDPSYDGVLALRPGRRAPRSRSRPSATRRPSSHGDLPLVRPLRRDRAGLPCGSGRGHAVTGAEALEPDPAVPGLDRPLPDRVRARVVALTADSLGRLPRRAGAGLADAGGGLRARPPGPAGGQPDRRACSTPTTPSASTWPRPCGPRSPSWPARSTRATPPAAADPVDLAAVAYLLAARRLGRTLVAAAARRPAEDAGAADRRGARGSSTGCAASSSSDREPAGDPRPAPRAARRAQGGERRRCGTSSATPATPRPRGRGGRRRRPDRRRGAGRAEAAAAPAPARRRGAPAARPGRGSSSATWPPSARPSAPSAGRRRPACAAAARHAARGRRRGCAGSWRCPPVDGLARRTPSRRTSPSSGSRDAVRGTARWPRTTRRCSSSCSRCRGRT